jgi:hypothetical protein
MILKNIEKILLSLFVLISLGSFSAGASATWTPIQIDIPGVSYTNGISTLPTVCEKETYFNVGAVAGFCTGVYTLWMPRIVIIPGFLVIPKYSIPLPGTIEVASCKVGLIHADLIRCAQACDIGYTNIDHPLNIIGHDQLCISDELATLTLDTILLVLSPFISNTSLTVIDWAIDTAANGIIGVGAVYDFAVTIIETVVNWSISMLNVSLESIAQLNNGLLEMKFGFIGNVIDTGIAITGAVAQCVFITPIECIVDVSTIINNVIVDITVTVVGGITTITANLAIFTLEQHTVLDKGLYSALVASWDFLVVGGTEMAFYITSVIVDGVWLISTTTGDLFIMTSAGINLAVTDFIIGFVLDGFDGTVNSFCNGFTAIGTECNFDSNAAFETALLKFHNDILQDIVAAKESLDSLSYGINNDAIELAKTALEHFQTKAEVSAFFIHINKIAGIQGIIDFLNNIKSLFPQNK